MFFIFSESLVFTYVDETLLRAVGTSRTGKWPRARVFPRTDVTSRAEQRDRDPSIAPPGGSGTVKPRWTRTTFFLTR